MNKEYISVSGVDTNSLPYDYLKSVKINGEAKAAIPLKEEEKKPDSFYKVSMGFQGHYNEPSLDLIVPRAVLDAGKGAIRVDMLYNPHTFRWEFAMSYDFHQGGDLDIITFKDSKDANKKDLAKVFAEQLKI